MKFKNHLEEQNMIYRWPWSTHNSLGSQNTKQKNSIKPRMLHLIVVFVWEY